jgi:hypothetical protein
MPGEHDCAFVRIEALTSSAGIFHPIGARLSAHSYGNRAVSFPIYFVTSSKREAEVIASLEKNQAPRELPWPGPAGTSPTPHCFVHLSTEAKRRQAEPVVDISGFGWQYYAENSDAIAELWGMALLRPARSRHSAALILAGSILDRPLRTRVRRQHQPLEPPARSAHGTPPSAVSAACQCMLCLTDHHGAAAATLDR